MNRKSISKGRRYDVFARDSFTCRFCGRKPPDVTLVVDHLIAVVRGGTDDPENLMTSCKECNQGKAAKSVNPLDFADDPRRAQEALEMMDLAKAFAKAKRAATKLRVDIYDHVDSVHGYSLSVSEITGIINIIKEFDMGTVFDWLAIADSAMERKGDKKTSSFVRYFFGIASNVRKRDAGK